MSESLKQIALAIDKYSKSNDSLDILQIVKKNVGYFFNVDSVTFLKIDTKQGTYTTFEEKDESLSLEKSILRELVNSKKSLFENHLISSKLYNTTIDNQPQMKIKSLLLFPIFKKNTLIGACMLFRKVGNRLSFSRKDEEKSLEISILLSYMFEKELIPKEIILEIKKRLKEMMVFSKKETPAKISSLDKDSKISYDDKVLNQEELYKALKLKYKASVLEFDENLAKTQKELVSWEEKYILIEDINKVLNQKEKNYLKKIELLESEIDTSIKNKKILNDLEVRVQISEKSLENEKKINNELIVKIEKQKQNVLEYKKISDELTYETTQVKLLKTEKSVERNNFSEGTDICRNMLSQGVEHFGVAQHTRVMFELILYAMYSSKGLKSLEEQLGSSNFLNVLLKKYSLRQTLPINVEKFKITDVVDQLNKYQDTVFKNIMRYKIKIKHDVPRYLNFDSRQVESLLLHLLVDMFQFVNHDKEINIDIQYINKNIVIDIYAQVHQKNSVFKLLLSKGDVFSDENGRVCLLFSKEILNYIGGSIKNKHKGENYSYNVTIPALIMKL